MKACFLSAAQQDIAVGDSGARLPDRAREGIQRMREQFVILVQKEQPVAPGGMKRGIAVRGKTAIRLAGDALDSPLVSAATWTVESELQSSQTTICSGARVWRKMLSMAPARVAAPL